MRAWPLLMVSLLVGLSASALADHTDRSPTRCDGGFCADGRDHIVDCVNGWCSGTASGFPTLVNPTYDEGEGLAPDELVIGLALGEAARAYPLRYVNWFETIEDTVAGEPLIVTYCPLCGSGIVWSRVLDGETLTIYNTGAIWMNDLVMYDVNTGSWWTQVGGEAIRGPMHGRVLELLPATIERWDPWHEAHPNTLALARPVDEQGRDLARYVRDPFASYEASRSTAQPRAVQDDRELHPKARVVGVVVNDEAFAFPTALMSELRLASVDVGGVRLVAAFGGEGVHVFEGGARSFTAAEDGWIVDASGRRWEAASGEAEDGSARLTRVAGRSVFWFAWLDFHPSTGLLDVEGEAIAAPTSVALDGDAEEVPNASPWPAGVLLVLGAVLAFVLGRRL